MFVPVSALDSSTWSNRTMCWPSLLSLTSAKRCWQEPPQQSYRALFSGMVLLLLSMHLAKEGSQLYICV